MTMISKLSYISYICLLLILPEALDNDYTRRCHMDCDPNEYDVKINETKDIILRAGSSIDNAIDSALITLFPDSYLPTVFHIRGNDSYVELLEIDEIFDKTTITFRDTVTTRIRTDLSCNEVETLLSNIYTLFVSRSVPVIDSVVYSSFYTTEPAYPLRFNVYSHNDTVTEEVKYKEWAKGGQRIYSKPFLSILEIIFETTRELEREYNKRN